MFKTQSPLKFFTSKGQKLHTVRSHNGGGGPTTHTHTHLHTHAHAHTLVLSQILKHKL